MLSFLLQVMSTQDKQDPFDQLWVPAKQSSFATKMRPRNEAAWGGSYSGGDIINYEYHGATVRLLNLHCDSMSLGDS